MDNRRTDVPCDLRIDRNGGILLSSDPRHAPPTVRRKRPTRTLPTAHALEINEVQHRLDTEMGFPDDSTARALADSLSIPVQDSAQTRIPHSPSFGRKYPIALNAFGDNSIKATLRQRYLKQRHLVDEVIYNNIDRLTDKPLEQRIDRTELDVLLKMNCNTTASTCASCTITSKYKPQTGVPC